MQYLAQGFAAKHVSVSSDKKVVGRDTFDTACSEPNCCISCHLD